MADTQKLKKPAKTEPIAFDGDGEPYVAGVADLTPIQGTYVPQSAPPMTSGEKIALSVVSLAGAGVLGLLVWTGIKADQKRDEEIKAENVKRKEASYALERWFEEQRKAGLVVVELATGEYMSVPAEAYQKSEIRKA